MSIQTIIIDEEGNITPVPASGPVEQPTPVPPEVGEQVTETDHFRFHAKHGYLPVEDLERFTLEAEAVFDYVSTRLETTTDAKTVVPFERPDASSCPFRGGTLFSADESMPSIIIYADERTSHVQALGVLAHELGHVLQTSGRESRWARWASPHLALTEGLATWAAGRYWHVWQGTPSFDASVRSYLDRGTYRPLYENYGLAEAYRGEDCVEKRDILYAEWASFIDFLLITYGMDRLEALLHSSPPQEMEINGEMAFVRTPADFEGVYGSALNQLEAVWLNHLTEQS